jgi:hypothetical protein
MKHLRLLAAFLMGWLFAVVGPGWHLRASQANPGKLDVPSGGHRVEFSGRTVFTGMRKTDFVSLFGEHVCKDKDWGDCLNVLHPGFTSSGVPIRDSEGTQLQLLDGFVTFDSSGRVELIVRGWPIPSNIDEFWSTFFNLMSGSVASGGSTVSIVALPGDSQGAYLFFTFKDGRSIHLRHLTGMAAGNQTGVSALIVSEYFR